MDGVIIYPFMNGMCLSCRDCDTSVLTCKKYRTKCFRVKECSQTDIGVSEEDIEKSKDSPIFTCEDTPYDSGKIIHAYSELYGKFTEDDFKTKWDLK